MVICHRNPTVSETRANTREAQNVFQAVISGFGSPHLLAARENFLELGSRPVPGGVFFSCLGIGPRPGLNGGNANG
jgi:hypothetical protein